MDNTVNFDLMSLIRPEILLLKILGFWKSKNPDSIDNSMGYKIYRALIMLSIALFQLFGYLYVYMKWDTITVSDISSVLFVYIQCFNNMTVISCIFFNMDTLQSIIQQLESEKHVDIAKELKKSGDFIRKYCIATSLSIIFLYPLTKLLGKNRQLLHTAYTPSWMSFTTLFVFQEFVTIYSVFICSNYLTLDANLMIEIGIQIEIMKDILESNTDINLIFEYIKYFDEILRLSGKVQHIFSIGISVHFVTGILVVCTTLFRLMEGLGVRVKCDLERNKRTEVYSNGEMLSRRDAHSHLLHNIWSQGGATAEGLGGQ
nr:unnamed protein product [Callosobruchus chinensis]